MASSFAAEMRRPKFDGRRSGKLGTEENPARITVPTEARAREVTAQFEKHGWKCEVEVVPDKPEDTADLQRLLNPPAPVTTEKKTDRNDPCPCGSGKKFKKCHGK